VGAKVTLAATTRVVQPPSPSAVVFRSEGTPPRYGRRLPETHPTRATKIARGLFGAAAVAPFGVIAALSRADLARWATTGVCPGGPMDHPAAPCGLFELVFRVFLGGWAAWLFIPVLSAWCGACALGYGLVRRRGARG